MMRRLAAQQGVKVRSGVLLTRLTRTLTPSLTPPPNTQVTNGMLLKQGIPVMIPVMWVACFVLIQQARI